MRYSSTWTYHDVSNNPILLPQRSIIEHFNKQLPMRLTSTQGGFIAVKIFSVSQAPIGS